MDTTKLKGLWEKVKDFFKNMSKKLRIILAAVLTVILMAIIILAVALSQRKPEYVQLYQNLTAQEASEIASYLQDSGYTDFQVAGGSTVMVRASQYESLLAQLALAGYPKDGSLYGSYWDNVGMMSTSSERATAFRIATQEKLESILRKFQGVRDADVVITPGEDRTFVLQDSSTKTTASVTLFLQNGVELTDENVDGIRYIVSKAWEGLTIDEVAVMDNNFNTYLGSSGASSSDAAGLQRYMENYYTNRIRSAVLELLEVIYGPGNVKVSPSVAMEVDEVYRETTTYNQPEGSYESGGLIGREVGWYAHTSDGYELVGGVPGTTTNADIPTYIYNEGQNDEDKDTVGASYERDNKIDETNEQRKILAPRIVDITLSVTLNANANPNASAGVDELRRHVALAAGLGDMTDEELQGRVSILVDAFYSEPDPDPVEPGLIPAEILPYVIIGAAAFVLLLIILIVVLVLRGKKKKKQQEEDQKIIEEQINELGGMAALGLAPEVQVDENGMPIVAPPLEGGADIMDINTEKSMELRKTVRQFVQSNPEVAAQMIKVWLRGEEDSE